jgi:nucleoside-triphosphatase THEP1
LISSRFRGGGAKKAYRIIDFKRDKAGILAEVRTANQVGKLRRRGRFTGYRSDWKKAYVTLKKGEKMPEYAEI